MVWVDDARDQNIYFAGRVHEHIVVMACSPTGINVLNAAATITEYKAVCQCLTGAKTATVSLCLIDEDV
jgi:hypothetical protein